MFLKNHISQSTILISCLLIYFCSGSSHCFITVLNSLGNAAALGQKALGLVKISL